MVKNFADIEIDVCRLAACATVAGDYIEDATCEMLEAGTIDRNVAEAITFAISEIQTMAAALAEDFNAALAAHLRARAA